MDIIAPIYQLTEKDAASRIAPIRATFNDSISGLNASQSRNTPSTFIAQDEVFVLKNFVADAVAGAAQTALTLQLDIIDVSSASQPVVARIDGSHPGTQFATLRGETEIVVFALEVIRLTVFYSGAAASNATRLDVIGFKVPRGNWQR